MLSDKAYEELISRLHAGDEEVIVVLYDNYAGALYGVILRIVPDESTAQEVLQDTFIKIWKNAQHYDPTQGRLFTWMMRIAKNTAINSVQSKQYRLRSQTDDDSSILCMSSDIKSDESFDLRHILSQVEEKYQCILKLVYFQGYTHQEVSDELDLPLGTVKSRVKIGLRQLRGIYDFVGTSYTALIISYIIVFN